MDPETAIEASREAIKVCLMIGGPVLAVCLIVGLLMGLAQAMSHVQDQALATVPKILAIFVVVGLALPWFADRMMDFSKDQFSRPFMAEAASASWVEPEQNTVQSLLAVPDKTTNVSYYPMTQTESGTAPVASAMRLSTDPVVRQASFKKQIETKPAAQSTEPSSPFSLPSYRFSRKPNGNIEG